MPPMAVHTPPIMALPVGGRLAENSSNTSCHESDVHARMAFEIKMINTIHWIRVTGKGRFMGQV
jgi:hypothetical protein